MVSTVAFICLYGDLIVTPTLAWRDISSKLIIRSTVFIFPKIKKVMQFCARLGRHACNTHIKWGQSYLNMMKYRINAKLIYKIYPFFSRHTEKLPIFKNWRYQFIWILKTEIYTGKRANRLLTACKINVIRKSTTITWCICGKNKYAMITKNDAMPLRIAVIKQLKS